MKKLIALVALLVLTSVFAVGCGGNKSTSENTDKPAETNTDKPAETAINGKAFDNAFMSFTYPKKWKVADVPNMKMVNLERGALGNAYILIKAEIDDTARTAKDFVTEFNKTVNGTTPENVTYGTTEYAKISFNYGGIDQTMLKVKIGNNLVSITLQGKGLMEDVGVLNLLKSIKYKF
jgi:hypothetical protein